MAHIDWLSYTVRKSITDVDRLLEYLPNVLPDELATEMFPIDLETFCTSTMKYDLRNGRFRYNWCIRFANGVDVLFEPSFSCSNDIRQQMGFHVVIPGSVLSNLKTPFDNIACSVWVSKMNSFCSVDLDDEIVADVHKFSWHLSRVDIAYDSNDVTMKEIWNKIEYGEYCTRATITMMSKITKYKQRLETVYIGNRSSDRFMRIYDKKVEQGLTDEECKNWVRMEMEFHNSSCVDALDCFCNGTIGGLFLGFFRFLENLNDSNRSRNEVWSKMADILDFREIVRVSKKNESNSDAFLKKVCIPMLLAYYQENPTFVINEVNRATASPTVIYKLRQEKARLGEYFGRSSLHLSNRQLKEMFADNPYLNESADSLWNKYSQLDLLEA